MGIFLQYRPCRTRGLAALALTVMISLALTACAAGPTATHTTLPTPSPTPTLTCTVSAPVTAPTLASARPATTLSLPGAPFASLASPDGQWLFVSLDATHLPAGVGPHNTSGLAVLRRTGPQRVTLAHILPLPDGPAGLALSPDGRLLAVADYTSVQFFDVALAEAGSPHADVGALATSAKASTIEALFSPHGHYLFATNEQTANISVFNLFATGSLNFQTSDNVGSIPVGLGPVDMALAPDGAHLYVTSLFSAAVARAYGPTMRLGFVGGLAEIDVSRAEHNPVQAVVGEALTGCEPVRVALSPDGKIAWVTAQSSNTLQAFDTSRIATDSGHALLATVAVGPNPTGLLLLNGGRYALVTNSDRWATPQTPQSMTVVDTQRALAGQPALVGNLPAGIFPRDLTQTGGAIALTNFGSYSISLIDAATLP